MSHLGEYSDINWSYSELERIDAVCDEFEAQWNQGLSPKIEDFLQKYGELARQLLLVELVRLERWLRQRTGASVTKEAYLVRFSNDVSAIERAWRKSPELPKTELPSTVAISKASESGFPVLSPKMSSRFKLLSRLGEGGFGVVYKAFDAVLGTEVALKIPHLDLIQNPERRKEILREAAVGERLDHPHLVRTLGTEEDGEQLLIVLQLVDGCNLAEWQRHYRPEPFVVAEVIATVAETLSFLHENGYVHRDLKPANILIDKDRQVYVTDFGLALHEDEQRKRKGELAGTRAFMSPEQVRRQVHLVDGQSDIWSLGVILYRLLTDRLPFGGAPPRRDSDDYSEYIRDLEYEILEHDPRPLRMIRPSLSRKLEEICLRSLEKRKRDRYPTGSDLAEDLRMYLEKASEGPTPSSSRSTIKIVPKGGLRSFDASDAEFFLELLPGPRTSTGFPASLNFWRNRISGSDGNTPLDIGAIVGPSGCGKSSFVKAGLLPALGNQIVPLIVDATLEDTEVRLLKRLRQALPGMSMDDSLIDVCRRVGERGAGGGRRILVVFDQFEQWLHANPEPKNSQLLQALHNCNGTRLQTLFLVREDFWPALNRFMDCLDIRLQEGVNQTAIDLFDREHARRILTALGRAHHRLHNETCTANEERFLTNAIDGLAEGGRVNCVRLVLFAEMMKDRPWDMQELAKVGGAKGIGVAFLEQKFGHFASAAYRPYCDAVRKVLDHLLPPYGSELKGQVRTLEELRLVAGYSNPVAFEKLVHILDSDLKLITPFARDEPGGDVPTRTGELVNAGDEKVEACYQLTHDFLVPSIRQWLTIELGRTRAGRAQLRLRERAEDWNRQPEVRRLPSLLEWLSIWMFAPRRSWTSAQKGMMKAADRHILFRAATIFAILALVSGTSWQVLGYLKAKALWSELLSAATSEVPGIIQKASPVQRWSQSIISNSYEQEFGGSQPVTLSERDESQYRRWLHQLMILGRTDHEKLLDLVGAIDRIAPADLSTVMKVLEPQRKIIAPLLAQKIASKSKQSELLTLATMLAWAQADHPHLPMAANEIASQLRDARPTQFPTWLNHLQPIAATLRKPLLEYWKSTPAPQGTARVQILEALNFLGGNDPATIVATIEDAEPAEFAILVPTLMRLDRHVDELTRRMTNAYLLDAKLGSAPPVNESLRQLFSSKCKGYCGDRGAYGIDIPVKDFSGLCAQLSKDGFRPIALRPYRRDGGLFVTAAWCRDGRKFRVELQTDSESFRTKAEELKRENFQIIDVALDEVHGEEPSWYGVWAEGAQDYPSSLLEFDNIKTKDLSLESKHIQEGFQLFRYVLRSGPGEDVKYSAIWQQDFSLPKTGIPSDELVSGVTLSPRSLDAFGDLKPGFLQTDLRGRLASKSLEFTGVWRVKLQNVRSQMFPRESGAELMAATEARINQGYSPTLVEPFEIEGAENTTFASIWQTPVLSIEARSRLASRLANVVLASALCGIEQPLIDLLKANSVDRDSRSMVLERLALSNFPIARLEVILAEADAAELKRNVLLAFGGYPSESATKEVGNRVSEMAATDPNAAVRSAAIWCAGKWKISAKEIKPLQGNPIEKNWTINSQGQTMIELNPTEFLMGSPEWEDGRDNDTSEQLGWMRITRAFAMSSTEVTVEQFRRFLEDPFVKSNLPATKYEILKSRNALNERMWDLACPQGGLTRLDAMLFCDWLGRQENVPQDQRCYPDIWEFLKKPPADLTDEEKKFGYLPPLGNDSLSRSGYRLPTEAEMEYAMRGGNSQSRHFGETSALLGAYAWHKENSDQKLQPVALKKPNEFGFFDLIGNSNEYCQNQYVAYNTPLDGYFRVDALTKNPKMEQTYYVLRGGSVEFPLRELRSARRKAAPAAHYQFSQGFRPARTLK